MNVGNEFNLIIQVSETDKIIENLWLGACPKDISKWKYVFAFNGKPTYHISLGQMVTIRPFDDIAVIPPEDMLHDMADAILVASRKGPTLVHCQAGLNRSALVLALALIHDGMAPIDAIKLLRDKRGQDVLYNKTFENWLLQQGTK